MARRTLREYQSSFGQHKYRAKKYGISFLFTFKEWFDWWGDDIDKRGNDKDSLCMCRVNDEGAYEPDNVYKDTRSNNSLFMIASGRHGKRLPDELIEEVQSYEPSGLPTRKVAELTGVSKSKVHKIFQQIRKGIS